MLQAFIIGLYFIAYIIISIIFLPLTFIQMIWGKKVAVKRGINIPPLTLK